MMHFEVKGELIGQTPLGDLYLLPGSGERVQDDIYGFGTVTNIAYARGLLFSGQAFIAKTVLYGGEENRKLVVDYGYYKIWPFNIRKIQSNGEFVAEQTPGTKDYYPDFENDRHQRNCCLKEIIVEVIGRAGKPELSYRLGNEWFWINGRINALTD